MEVCKNRSQMRHIEQQKMTVVLIPQLWATLNIFNDIGQGILKKMRDAKCNVTAGSLSSYLMLPRNRSSQNLSRHTSELSPVRTTSRPTCASIQEISTDAHGFPP